MTIRKVADIIIRASPNGRLNVTGSELKFYSYDKNSAAIDFYIQNQDRTPTDLFNVDVKLMLLTRENNEWKQFTAFDGVEIISGLDGHARYVIPDELRGYQGVVEGYVYLDFNDDSRSDECYFNFTIERSRIEEEFEHAGEYYIKEIQDTLDETIAELKKYAAEKINEYEAQLSSLNSKISNTTTLVDSLATQTTSIQAKQAEILKLIADNNVATKQDIEVAKQESSANVVDQVIGKEKVRTIIRLDFVGKKVNSLVENRNVGKFSYANTSILLPNSTNFFENSQNGYDCLEKLDEQYLNGSITIRDGIAQELLSYDVLPLIRDFVGEQYFIDHGVQSAEDYVLVARNIVKSMSSHVVGSGLSANGDSLLLKTYVNDSNWSVGGGYNTSSSIQDLNHTLSNSNADFISLDGKIHATAYAGKSDGSTPSQIKLDHAYVDIVIELSANEHIKYLIAANHVENLATQDEAESGTDNKKTMTPLRVFQAIAKWTKEKFVNKTGDETIAGAKNFTSTPLVNSVAVAKSDNVLNLIDPQTALGLKNFKNGIQLNGLNIASEYAKAVDTDKYNRKGAVYLGGNVWIAWETLTFQNTSGYSKGSYIRLGSDNNAAFTYPDVKNTTGGYIWLGGACQPDYTDGGFGSYHITIENNFDDARKPIVRFVDSPTTPVKKLAVRGVALIFAPPPTENSKI